MTASEISELIGEMLEIGDMALDDNFFDVGGNSLLALELMTQLEERSGVKISLLDVIRAPSPDQLAVIIADRSHNGSGPEAAARAQ
jgi:acyl carrier protein